MAVTLEGLGLGVPLSPGSGWQVQAIKVRTISFLPWRVLFLSEPLSCLPLLSWTSSHFFSLLTWLWEVNLLVAPFRKGSEAVPEWGLPL